MYYVYKFMNKSDEVIYVGRTNDLTTRMNQHFNAKDKETVERNELVVKIYFVELKSKNHSHMYEIQMIDFYKPQYNKDYFEESQNELLIDLDKLVFNVFDEMKLKKLKNKKQKKVNSLKIKKLNKYDKETVDFYIKEYGFTESEGYMTLKILEMSYGQGFLMNSIVSKKDCITFNMANEFVNKLIDMKVVEKYDFTSSFNDEEIYKLSETFIYEKFEL